MSLSASFCSWKHWCKVIFSVTGDWKFISAPQNILAYKAPWCKFEIGVPSSKALTQVLGTWLPRNLEWPYTWFSESFTTQISLLEHEWIGKVHMPFFLPEDRTQMNRSSDERTNTSEAGRKESTKNLRCFAKAIKELSGSVYLAT